MARGKGEIKGWITKNGVHIPIYDHYTVREGHEPENVKAKFKGKKKEDNLKAVEPAKGLKDGTPTKLSDSCFRSSYYELKKLYKEANNKKDEFVLSDFKGYDRENTLLSTQVYNGIQHSINRTRKDLDFDYKLGVVKKAEYELETRALNAMQKTLNERWKVHKE